MFFLYVVAIKKELRALTVNLAHRCAIVEAEVSKASKESKLEMENSLLIQDSEEDRHLKDGTI